MFPLLPFAAGLLTGAVVTRLIKPEKARTTLDKAQERVREATVSSLAAIEHTSAGLRARLTQAAEESPESEGRFDFEPETDEQPQSGGAAQSGAESTPEPVEKSAETAAAPKRTRRRTATKAAKSTESPGRTDESDGEAM